MATAGSAVIELNGVHVVVSPQAFQTRGLTAHSEQEITLEHLLLCDSIVVAMALPVFALP